MVMWKDIEQPIASWGYFCYMCHSKGTKRRTVDTFIVGSIACDEHAIEGDRLFEQDFKYMEQRMSEYAFHSLRDLIHYNSTGILPADYYNDESEDVDDEEWEDAEEDWKEDEDESD